MKPFIEYRIDLKNWLFRKTEDIEMIDHVKSYDLMYRIENTLAIDHDSGTPSCFVVISKDVWNHDEILNRILKIFKETS